MAQPALNPSYPLASSLTLNPAALGLQPGLERWTAPPANQPLMRAPQPLTPPPSPLQEAIARTDSRFVSFGWGPQQRLPFECVHHAIEAQAQQQPDAWAVEHQGQAWTYGQLNAYAEYLARRLEAQGVVRGDRVGVFLQRGFPMVVSILAILKVGAAYVPQDAGVVPAPMLRQVMDSAGIQVVLSTASFIPGLPLARDDVAIDVQSLCSTTPPPAHPSRLRKPYVAGSDLCFVLYTSGTTGKPNGVMVTHRNVCNIIHTAPGNLGMAPGQRVGQVLNIGFDMAAWEILGCLSHGATLVIRGKDFAETAATVNVLIATPSILAKLDPAACPHIQAVALAGEPCPRPLAEAWAARCAFHNGCGPTEVTIVNTLAQFKPGDEVLSIGTPTPNNTVYVLNEDMQPCAIGEVGEMWAGGDCVSAGYIGNPGLTAERYRPDPFLGGGRMMFRTRDLCRWTEQGQLEHFGRVDDQVKVRGFRVELDAVSTVLERSPGCRRAVTLKANSRDLVAFVTPATVDVADAQDQVRRSLPYYCVPALVIAIDELPMTERGKVDKRLLLAQAQPLLDAHNASLGETA
ncbi:amino acid adenylation domain-containing protein [Ideonella paludis]|uniref:Amino acid adenylation domain-containing protein n=1 Tax=Ideonella paludis TaxID=1233411 RepID=A0ABS5DY15_9BURK|nr:amino acid adenylation domain-containing protein [Ideonella paludis]MBQ0936047.1 amino acid adenylation domain-containing protein [Ideonella paludis]